MRHKSDDNVAPESWGGGLDTAFDSGIEHEKCIFLNLWQAVSALNSARHEYAMMVKKDIHLINNKDFAEAVMAVDEALFKLTEPNEKLQASMLRRSV